MITFGGSEGAFFLGFEFFKHLAIFWLQLKYREIDKKIALSKGFSARQA